MDYTQSLRRIAQRQGASFFSLAFLISMEEELVVLDILFQYFKERKPVNVFPAEGKTIL